MLFLSFFILKHFLSLFVFSFLIHSFNHLLHHTHTYFIGRNFADISRRHSIIQKLVFSQLSIRNCRIIVPYDRILIIVHNLTLEFYRVFSFNLILIDYCKFKDNIIYCRQCLKSIDFPAELSSSNFFYVRLSEHKS